MIEEIMKAIINALHEVFGDKYPIYTEEVKQGFKNPCFSVFCVSPQETQYLGRRSLRKHLFCINYFPSECEEQRAECCSVLEKLLLIVEVIGEDGNQFRGTNMNGRIEDNVLVFNVNYDLFVHRVPVEKLDMMDDVGLEERVIQDEES